MLIQISAGQGPAECEFAVGLLAKSFQDEFNNLETGKRRKVAARKLLQFNNFENRRRRKEKRNFKIGRHNSLDMSKSFSSASQKKKLVRRREHYF